MYVAEIKVKRSLGTVFSYSTPKVNKVQQALDIARDIALSAEPLNGCDGFDFTHNRDGLAIGKVYDHKGVNYTVICTVYHVEQYALSKYDRID